MTNSEDIEKLIKDHYPYLIDDYNFEVIESGNDGMWGHIILGNKYLKLVFAYDRGDIHLYFKYMLNSKEHYLNAAYLFCLVDLEPCHHMAKSEIFMEPFNSNFDTIHRAFNPSKLNETHLKLKSVKAKL